MGHMSHRTTTELFQKVDDIHPGLRAEMEGQRGMLARVVEGGEMRVGDAISVEGVG